MKNHFCGSLYITIENYFLFIGIVEIGTTNIKYLSYCIENISLLNIKFGIEAIKGFKFLGK